MLWLCVSLLCSPLLGTCARVLDVFPLTSGCSRSPEDISPSPSLVLSRSISLSPSLCFRAPCALFYNGIALSLYLAGSISISSIRRFLFRFSTLMLACLEARDPSWKELILNILFAKICYYSH
uniref:Putative secreted peptide n=1 Tax=Anopheles braziliensis TaxID=58242 RepID=A0A2M3ZRW2_9DIPT